MDVRITITYAGTGVSNLLDIYTNETGPWTLYIADVPLASLLAGYVFTPPVGATGYQVRDKGVCETILYLDCTMTTTTTSTSTSTTSTTTSTTSTSTTSTSTTTTTTTAEITTTTTTTGETTTTTTTTEEVIPEIYRYFGVDYYVDNPPEYVTAEEACADGDCDPETAVNCSSYYSYFNTINMGDIVYKTPAMSDVFDGGGFWWSMIYKPWVGDAVDPVYSVQIDASGEVIGVVSCTTTTTTTLAPTTTTTTTTEEVTTTTTTTSA